MRRFFLPTQKPKGFTLLELMIVSGFLIITLVGLLATYISCLELTEMTKNTNLALNMAQKVMEEIRNTPITSISGTYNGYAFNVPGMAANSSLGHVTVLDNIDPDLPPYNVTIGVCWRQKGGRIIGECQDSGGVLVFSDANLNGVLDSSVQLSTQMAQR